MAKTAIQEVGGYTKSRLLRTVIFTVAASRRLARHPG
jgi:hypothetical protein